MSMYITAKTPREYCRLEQLDDKRWRAYHLAQGKVIDTPEQIWDDNWTAIGELQAAGWTLIALTTPPGKTMPNHVYIRYLPEEPESRAK